ncbi:CYTH domain-containing protein [Candidatus Saccharibacteria bacterium]|nr:CYTH domain-containing protein [Candidatus Saccharibacteria bacterium]
MKAEIEAKFLNVDKENIRKLLKNIGAELVAPERLMNRAVFDGKRKSEYYRVRNEGNQITMSFKREEKRSIEGMKEICLTVDNYNNAVEFLTSLAGKPKALQETYRESWVKDGVEIDIDTWPWIPSFIEIEGKSTEAVKGIADKLGLKMVDAKYGSVGIAYRQVFDVTDEDINDMPEIKFTDIPEWLEKRRKQ